MIYILLASIAGNFANHINAKIVTKNIKPQATFVTTAANLYSKKQWMEDDISGFEKVGVKINRVDFSSLSKNESKKVIEQSEILIMGGGNPIYLLEQLVEKDLLKMIQQRVAQGMVYIGSSAGAVIASPNISLEKKFDDRKNLKLLNSYKALNLINLLLMPHWNNPSFKNEYLEMLKLAYEQDIPLLSITDYQAIEIEEGSFKIIESK